MLDRRAVKLVDVLEKVLRGELGLDVEVVGELAELERQFHQDAVAVAEVGEARARVWRLYMAGSAINFEAGRSNIHQVLGVPRSDDGTSGMPLRPVFQ